MKTRLEETKKFLPLGGEARREIILHLGNRDSPCAVCKIGQRRKGTISSHDNCDLIGSSSLCSSQLKKVRKSMFLYDVDEEERRGCGLGLPSLFSS